LLSQAVGVAQGYDRVALERPEHAVERRLDLNRIDAGDLSIQVRRDLGMAR
jgi:hypothetical protein